MVTSHAGWKRAEFHTGHSSLLMYGPSDEKSVELDESTAVPAVRSRRSRKRDEMDHGTSRRRSYSKLGSVG